MLDVKMRFGGGRVDDRFGTRFIVYRGRDG